MRKIGLSYTAAAVLVAGMVSGAHASALENIISNPKVNLEIRPRYEYANVKNNNKKAAKAFTVRTSLGLNAQLFGVEGLGAQIQMMSVDNFGWIDKYNDLAGNGTKYDIVADPAQTRVTQANISYSLNGFTGIVGRKMIVLDNARFIGNVGWRQMPQTFDLAAVLYNGIENLSLLGAYVNRVHTVLKNGKIDTGSVLLHGAYTVAPELKVTVYDYMIQNFADHIGIRLTGKTAFNEVKVNYTAEYAKQNDPSMTDSKEKILVPGITSTSAINQDASYYNINAGLNYQGFIAGLGYEVLGKANGGVMEFYTPLATLHAHNGWADVFLKGTGTNMGLKDFTVKLGYNAGAYGKIIGIYHKFDSDAGSYDFGKEFDVAYNYKINKNLGLLLKGAFYKGGDKIATSANPIIKNAYDVTKYWVQLDYKFFAGL